MALRARGRTNELIAEELGIALGTVKTHVHNILRKLDVDNRRDAGTYWRLYRRMEQKGMGLPPPRGHRLAG